MISDVLRQTIRDSGQSVYRISKGSGVPYPCVHHFLHERRTVTLPVADKLCDYFGFELTPRAIPKKKRRRK